MKQLLFLISFLFSFSAFAQSFPRDTIVNNGNINNRINMVYLSDGYTAAEIGTYQADVANINNRLFLTTPFKEYRKYFNAFAVKVPSTASGAKHPKTASDCPPEATQPIASPSNYFGSRFDVGGIHRLVVPENTILIQSVLALSAPFYDQAIMVVNSEFYGGSGGAYATSTKHTSATEIAIHELGHSFGGLSDEYWAGNQYARESPNMTANSNTSTVRWKNWLGTNGIGVYTHSGIPNWFRPTQNAVCKMEVLGVPFCSVCIEAMVEKIHSMVDPYDSYAPSSTSLVKTGSDMGFKLNLLAPEPNTLKVTWKLNGNTFATNTDTATVSAASLSLSNNQVSVTILDTTALTRSESHLSTHAYMINWNISTATGIIDPELIKINLKAYPNPFTTGLNIDYKLEKTANVKIELVNLSGQTVAKKELGKQPVGSHSTFFSTNSTLTNGLYFLIFTVDGKRIVEEKIRIGN